MPIQVAAAAAAAAAAVVTSSRPSWENRTASCAGALITLSELSRC